MDARTPLAGDDPPTRGAPATSAIAHPKDRDATVRNGRKSDMRAILVALVVAAFVLSPVASHAAAARCSNGKSTDAAMWYSIAHPGLGEWYLKDWGSFRSEEHRLNSSH